LTPAPFILPLQGLHEVRYGRISRLTGHEQMNMIGSYAVGQQPNIAIGSQLDYSKQYTDGLRERHVQIVYDDERAALAKVSGFIYKCIAQLSA